MGTVEALGALLDELTGAEPAALADEATVVELHRQHARLEAVLARATRRAVEVRDRECFHGLCDLPADRCQIDHVQPWAHAGPTVQANGRPACAAHNRGRHRRRRP